MLVSAYFVRLSWVSLAFMRIYAGLLTGFKAVIFKQAG
jgi:hypothetical protein